MKPILEKLWYLFVIVSWVLVLTVYFTGVMSWSYIIVILFGLILYGLKVRHINGLTFNDLNYKTIVYYLVYYLVLYFSFVLVGIGVWGLIYAAASYISPELFKKMFPDNTAFYIIASRMTLTGSAFYLVICAAAGLHRHYRQLRFTNKIPLLDVLFVIIALIWLSFSWNFIGLFISVISVNTAPELIRLYFSKFISAVFKRDINFTHQDNEDNEENIEFIETREGHIKAFYATLKMIVVHCGIVHLKLAVVMLLLGGTFVYSRHYI